MIHAKQLLLVAIIFPSIILFGAAGLRSLEGWSWADALYMSVITITTVGFGEVHPLSSAGRIFTALLILLGVGGITFTFGAITNYLVAGELRGILKERKMRRVIDSLRGQYIVCGYGEMGRQVCRELNQAGHAVVVVDIDERAVNRAKEASYLAFQGDAGLDTVLTNCGIENAVGLVAATDDDATNLLVVLSARVLKNDLKIVARANLEEVAEKLYRTGADRVLVPQAIAGRRMAQMLLHPEICDFLDVVTHDESLELVLENFEICPGAKIADLSLMDSQIRETTGASIVGLKRPGIGIIPSLMSSTILQAGDTVFALGTREQVEKLGRLIDLECGQQD
jgi:voltage-gated potassium channel